jgi:hypothetical protein
MLASMVLFIGSVAFPLFMLALLFDVEVPYISDFLGTADKWKCYALAAILIGPGALLVWIVDKLEKKKS